jgi:hypothetical protein
MRIRLWQMVCIQKSSGFFLRANGIFFRQSWVLMDEELIEFHERVFNAEEHFRVRAMCAAGGVTYQNVETFWRRIKYELTELVSFISKLYIFYSHTSVCNALLGFRPHGFCNTGRSRTNHSATILELAIRRGHLLSVIRH